MRLLEKYEKNTTAIVLWEEKLSRKDPFIGFSFICLDGVCRWYFTLAFKLYLIMKFLHNLQILNDCQFSSVLINLIG